VAVQDEIEIEIAEVLYGMMRMPTSSKQEEKTTVDIKARVSSPISITLAANSSSTNVSAIGKVFSAHNDLLSCCCFLLFAHFLFIFIWS